MIQFGKERCCSNEKIIIDSFLESTNKLIIEKLQKNQINKPGLYSGMLGDLLFCRYYAELYSKELTLYESVENIVLTEVFS
ncbi:hypothetical protein [Saccharicrinis fermentans]|uniref:Uncharacterized protein n=1 Tax=Saccharicrinis fermentans DSM 9555 = JCM 21142 TaxID=869213 RepID=W7YTN5_9BACT|nr:hypothetical protein [Saccharicrinis fermentans]GAF05819.1 hypothetical protein JCM21142_114573 [Saccharicrinis fermentans DSM 9555 = JCM 21142]